MMLFTLFIMSLFMAMDLSSFNRFFDFFVPVYTIAVIAFLVALARKKKAEAPEADASARVYALKKKAKTENLSWKQKFVGTWAKIERKGFYEVLHILYGIV